MLSDRVEAAWGKGSDAARLIQLPAIAHHPFTRKLLEIAEKPLVRCLCIDQLNAAYENITRQHQDGDFFATAVQCLDLKSEISDADLRKIPGYGPLVVVANHPFGGVDGLLLGYHLTRRRTDVKFLGNYLLNGIPEMRPYLLQVDPFAQRSSTGANARTLKEAIRWLRQGACLVVFPAGEVSSYKIREGLNTDRPWSKHVAAMVRYGEAAVLPVYFPGSNSRVFQAVGFIHSLLRTALLPRELVKKQGQTVSLYFGKTIAPDEWQEHRSNEGMTAFLRNRCYVLQYRSPGSAALRQCADEMRNPAHVEALNEALPPEKLAAEIDTLPSQQILVEHAAYRVMYASAAQAPLLLRELGRLRELTFRSASEGTGKSIDLDAFDDYYLHLFAWNDEEREVVGAYRLGLCDRILAERGLDGLYTAGLFRFQPGFARHLDDALEMGRSFIREEYQRKFGCLSLLWRGIGAFLVAHPRYRVLFGPVSIGRSYGPVSRVLMLRYLERYRYDAILGRLVAARQAFQAEQYESSIVRQVQQQLHSAAAVSRLVADLEADGKGLPILLQHYLKLNGRLLGFNVDPAFSDVIDGLIRVDLRQTETRFLKRFMGKEGYERFSVYGESCAQGFRASP